MDGYLVGAFPPPWVEWNDRYRDTVRDFWRAHTGGGVRDVALPARRLLGPVRRRRPLAVRLGQLRHRPRRLHPARPRLLRRASTTRRTASTTATAATTTGRGTTASRARPTTRRSCALRHRQAANMMATLLPVHRRPDAHRRATSAAAPSAATTTPTARTTRSRGSTGARTTPGSTSTRSPRPRCGCAASTRRCGSATTSRGSPTIDGGPKDLAWLAPRRAAR